MDIKLYCPHCGRCLGQCLSSSSASRCKVLVSPPNKIKSKYFIHNMKCFKCKNEIYILMGFDD